MFELGALRGVQPISAGTINSNFLVETERGRWFLRVNEGKAESDGLVLYSFELVFAGMFRVVNVPSDSLQPFVLIECPRLLFPFAREIVATSVRNGGFQPLLLNPIDFVDLYRQRLAAAPAAPPLNPT